MFVKILNTKKGLFLEDEVGIFRGYINFEDFVECCLEEDPRILEDEEEYWFVDRDLLLKSVF